jgi:hypothetical protein
MQASGISADDVGNLGPRPCLPNAKILVPKSGPRTEQRGISQKQSGERIERSATDHVGLNPKNRRVGSPLLMVTPARFSRQPCGFRMIQHYNGSKVPQVLA